MCKTPLSFATDGYSVRLRRGGRLDLGTWQHVYVVELYEPRRREVDVAVVG